MIMNCFFKSYSLLKSSKFQVYCEGQLICAIAANSSAVAHEAAALVKVEYEELPAIITIEVLISNKMDCLSN